ncbi:NACHT domain-containing protein [Amycolatopsis rifamycinica]|uniref:NACHT domain-containing protein n=1 Tax=Amycolatopsis rifamycinica TaxID=287986 RepID=A0A066TZD0_9PSEU|nr:hypothetical protein [Amycolatopsis rifamycinica]KDN20566.1 hypothetical protein DV20_19320 [Amycolatopsis rifamycinica]
MSGRLVLRTLVGLLLSVVTAIAVNAATSVTFPGPLRLIQRYPWWAVGVAVLATCAYVVWDIRATRASRADLTPAQSDRLRDRLLHGTRWIWVDGVLARSLGEVLRLELSLQPRRTKVTHPVHLLLPGHDDVLPAGTPPVDVYGRYGEQLLILGAPGAGKSTMLLELARDLLARAEKDPVTQIPVVLHLSSWPPKDDIPFETWVVNELRRFYGVSPAHGRYAVESGMVSLLLDGLDEVPAGRARKCVTALNRFRDRRPGTSIAVTCRVQDYDDIETRLKLAGAVLIQPLTPEAADAWLAELGPELDGLRAVLDGDESLRDLVRTPLTLTIAAFAYQGREVTVFTGLDSLFAAYTHRMLERSRAALADTTGYDEAVARRWFATLARGMVEVGTIAISPELPARIRVGWIDRDAVPWSRLPRWLLLAGLPMALLAGVTTFVIGPWPAAPFVAVLTGATAWIRADAPSWFTGEHSYKSNLETTGEEFRREQAGWAAVFGLAAIGVLMAVVFIRMLITTEELGWFNTVFTSVSMGLILTLTAALSGFSWVTGLSNVVAEFTQDAIRGVSRWLGPRATAVLAVLVAGAAAGGAGAIVGHVLGALGAFAVFGGDLWPWHLVFGLGLAVVFGSAGGLVLAAQYAVSDTFTAPLVYRHLARAGALPPDLGHFLAWADDRILLRRTGADYQFVHRLYRDWWAGRDQSRDST